MKSVYSPSQHVIYNAAFYDDYKQAGTWPSDGIEISEEDAILFNGSMEPTGKMLDYIDGVFLWVGRPEPELSKEQAIAQAEQKKLSLRSSADSEISWRQYALEAGIATEDEERSLSEWKTYRVNLMRVSTSLAPKLNWPKVPD